MHIKKIYKTMELIDERLSQLTKEEYMHYIHGTGLLTLLEECIDEILWDNASKQLFWSSYMRYNEDTPCENNVSYHILLKFFIAASVPIHQKYRN